MIGPLRDPSGMTTARSQLVDSAVPGFYHCVSRCVRRAWLCGVDSYSGRSFEHRRSWIEERLLELADIFAAGVYAYAVMSNHVHVVLRVDPDAAQAWSDEEVATRWVRLFPARINGIVDPDLCGVKEQALLGRADRLAECRGRLASLAWFMRCLNEPIARRANREDACTGRFWEGRYKCQALLDDAAVLACMSYVDLNPIRAGLADDLPSSAHTGAARRVAEVENDRALAGQPLVPWGMATGAGIPIHTAAYLELIDWTARLVRADKRGVIDAAVPPILARLGLPERAWQCQVLGIESRYWRAIGCAASILEKAAAMGQCWLKGIGTAQRLVESGA
jgi:REP element-mobilizing transposase RayT